MCPRQVPRDVGQLTALQGEDRASRRCGAAGATASRTPRRSSARIAFANRVMPAPRGRSAAPARARRPHYLSGAGRSRRSARRSSADDDDPHAVIFRRRACERNSWISREAANAPWAAAGGHLRCPRPARPAWLEVSARDVPRGEPAYHGGVVAAARDRCKYLAGDASAIARATGLFVWEQPACTGSTAQPNAEPHARSSWKSSARDVGVLIGCPIPSMLPSLSRNQAPHSPLPLLR